MQQFFEFPVTPAFSFESFVVCDGNAAALQFARRIADPADPENLLYLHGPSGSGKTHLLKAVVQTLNVAGSCPVPYLSCGEAFTPEGLSSRFAGSAALIVDDLQLLPDDAALRAALWQLFNDFHGSGRKVALAGLYPPRELPGLDDHLVSRLLWGLVARVDASDDRSRRMILMKIADDRQVRVPDEVMEYILVTASREVGELIAVFEALYRLSMAEKRRITLPLARECRELLAAGGRAR
ncbi:MAG: DnaA regulatory inactivator Hda [Deltaproteobacteria bacterium]|nr:DnaA regulatory inactivator Hda [Deltaproteobacteria bacterium]